jgi:hypothetical protein
VTRRLLPLLLIGLLVLYSGCMGGEDAGKGTPSVSVAPPEVSPEANGSSPVVTEIPKSPNKPLLREQLDPYPDLKTALDPVCAEPPVPEMECPEGMAFIDQCGGFCIDKYEAHDAGGGVAGSAPGTRPWVDINWHDAKAACEAVGKRLCKDFEWMAACNLDGDKYFLTEEEENETYGCHTKGSIGSDETGFRANCRSAEGVFDMIGNVFEWTDAQVPSDTWGGSSEPVGTALGEDGSKYGGDWVYHDSSYMKEGNVFLRGGDWYNYAGGSPGFGCFYLGLYGVPSDTYPSFGFRCCVDA